MSTRAHFFRPKKKVEKHLAFFEVSKAIIAPLASVIGAPGSTPLPRFPILVRVCQPLHVMGGDCIPCDSWSFLSCKQVPEYHQRANSRLLYTPSEDRLFIVGLEMHGQELKKIAGSILPMSHGQLLNRYDCGGGGVHPHVGCA